MGQKRKDRPLRLSENPESSVLGLEFMRPFGDERQVFGQPALGLPENLGYDANLEAELMRLFEDEWQVIGQLPFVSVSG